MESSAWERRDRLPCRWRSAGIGARIGHDEHLRLSPNANSAGIPALPPASRSLFCGSGAAVNAAGGRPILNTSWSPAALLTRPAAPVIGRPAIRRQTAIGWRAASSPRRRRS